MAEETQPSALVDNKRKFEDPPPPRRPTGFSAPIVSPSPDNGGGGGAAVAPPPTYGSVPPPPDEFQLAKQRVQEAAARLLSEAQSKRPRVENGGGGDDSGDKGFSSAPSDAYHKPPSQHAPSPAGMQASYPSYGSYMGPGKKIEIPNGRVGVIIGRGGETIKHLQMQSGAKIQVTKDSEADPYSQTRIVELTGTADQMSRAEELIKDVLAEAEAGGSSNMSSRRTGGGQVGAGQLSMSVPNDKVGLIIGKSGDTIRSMQASSGARIQIIPLHPRPGEILTERTVHIDGTAEQIESAKQLVTDIINGNRPRIPQMSGGYSHQGYRPPRPPASWGPPGQPPMQHPGYGYSQQGTYPAAPTQYSQPPYGGYPQPAGGLQTGWDQASNQPAQQTDPGTGYDYYNQQQQNPQPAGGSNPADNTGYNYGQHPTYGSQGQYADATYAQPTTGQQQAYGQENAAGYGNAPAAQPGYSQPTSNPQGWYDNQQGYGSAPAYGTASNPTQDGSATTYGVQGGSTQTPPSQGAAQPPNQQVYAGQPASTGAVSYTSQGAAQPGYGMPQTSQPGYGGQPQSLTSSQQGYGQQPEAQNPPGQTAYGQSQPPTSQAGYMQPSPVPAGYQTGYAQDPSQHQGQHGYGNGGSQAGYAQQQYGGGTAVYGQQQQQAYADSYTGGGYTQPPAYATDAPPHGSYEAPAATQSAPSVPSGVTKASPQS